MRFTLHFGSLTFPDGAGAARIARAAEAAGFHSIIAVDHVALPDEYVSTYPYAATGRLPGGATVPFPDPLIWLSFAAAATTHLRLLTGVMILPLREPLVLAKQVATLDAMSGGRMELGIGVGWLKEEFEALGVPFAQRGKRTDDYVAAMRALWSRDSASHDGPFARFSGMNSNPKPLRGAVPIVVGGHTEAAARRAGRLGDGFFPSIGAQLDVLPLIDIVRRHAEAAGRDPGAVELILGCPDALPGSGKDPQEAVAARQKLGVQRIVVPVQAFMPDWEAGLARFGETVIRPMSGG